MPKRRKKTPEELKADLREFDRVCTREFRKAMQNLGERMVWRPYHGGKRPRLYKMKFPRLTRTVVIPDEPIQS